MYNVEYRSDRKYTMSSTGVTENKELGISMKQVVINRFFVPFQYFPEGTEEKYFNTVSGESVF
jgi:hypothetical protein